MHALGTICVMQRSKFYQFFPPPSFLQMPAVGLDVSDMSVRFTELIEKHRGFTIGRFGERAIPRGVIESGEVKKAADLRSVFSDIKKTYNLEFVSVSLPEERSYLFELRIPVMKYSEVRGVVELSLEEHVPIKADEVLFDYDIVKETESFFDVSVSVVPRALVDGYLEAFIGSGITPVAFEIEAHSVARSVVPEGDKNTSMIVDFGKLRTGITIVSDGIVRFTSTIPVGGFLITDAISRKLNIPPDAAETIKQEKGIHIGDGDKELSTPIISVVSLLRDEINKHLSYWQIHTDDYGDKRSAIQKIYLCGGDSNLVGFLDYLSSGLPVHVELANVMVNVDTLEEYIPEISFSDSLRYATSIGIALRHPM